MTSLVVLAFLLPASSSSPLPPLVLAPDAPVTGCPNARQVTEALQFRLPGAVVSASERAQASPRDILRSVLETPADGNTVRFSLIDSHGETRLRRTLPIANPGKPVECQALADTLAAVVERFLYFPTYESNDSLPLKTLPAPTARPANTLSAGLAIAPPGSIARPQSLLFVGGTLRIDPVHSSNEIEGRIGGQLGLRGSPLHLALTASVGYAPERRRDNATLRRFPARAGAVATIAAGPGWVEPILELGLDVLSVTASSFHVEPGDLSVEERDILAVVSANGALAYRLAIGKRLFVRARVGAGLALVRYDVVTKETLEVLFQTPRAYAIAGFETGVVFR